MAEHDRGAARSARSELRAASPAGPAAGGGGLGPRRCDFCGEPSATVRRVALDRDYDRLLKPHRELYACPPCSEAKERRRLGLERG